MAWFLSPQTILNADFENGDLSNWNNITENSSFFTLNDAVVFSGDYSARLQGVDSQFNAGASDVFTINPNHTYQFKGYTRLSSLSANDFRIRVRQYENQADNISSQFLTTNAVVDSDLHDYALQSFTMGPSGDTVDITLMDCANGISVDIAFPDESSGNLAYIDQFNVYQSLEVIPMWGYKPNLNKIESDMRTKSGRLYKRQMATWRNFNVPVEFFPSSKAVLVNSWFKDNTKLMWVVTSGDDTQVFSVRITNNARPFDSFHPANEDLFRGAIRLEEY
jgi:hypothetical protein